MPKTIAIVGAGPGVGYAVAERFGREGYAVALLARDEQKTGAIVERLAKTGIGAAAFRADVLDRSGLERALAAAVKRFGAIDVLEYSPTPAPDSMRGPRDIDVTNEQSHLDLQVLGPITAVRAVLPGMLERGAGSLLFTTAASAQHPAAMTASFGVAAGALLNYARLLDVDLRPAGIRVGIVSIAALVVEDLSQDIPGFPPGVPKIVAADVAEQHWQAHAGQAELEQYAGDIDALLKVPGLY